MTTGPLEAVLFDFGGVFTSSPFAAARRHGEVLGIDPDRALEVAFGPYDEDTDHPWHRAERGEIDLVTCHAEISARAAAEGFELDLFDMLRSLGDDDGDGRAPGEVIRQPVVAAVRAVRAGGVRTALVTNNIAELASLWRPLLPLDELFDVVIDSSEEGVRKPDPRIYHLTLERLGGVAPERSVFLDDYPGNVAAAQALGMAGILVGPDPAAALAELGELLGG